MSEAPRGHENLGDGEMDGRVFFFFLCSFVLMFVSSLKNVFALILLVSFFCAPECFFDVFFSEI